ncbi:transposase [Planctomicrobium sp. SH664]|uniref:transposase n=1 Tax=Planctomicrobium sp. SH664 TaxID=3448125 RepID=UPI003F5BD2D3
MRRLRPAVSGTQSWRIHHQTALRREWLWTPPASALTAGQRGDAPQAKVLLNQVSSGTPRHTVADAAYDSDALRKQSRQLKAKVCIRPNPTRKRKKCYDKQRHKLRDVIERFFRRIKRCRLCATHYEKKSCIFAGFIRLAAVAGRLRDAGKSARIGM